MSIGKSSTQPSSQSGTAPAPAGPSVSATQTSPPPQFQNWYNALGGQAMSLASQPWVGPYPGQLVSRFTPQQMQAFQQVNQLQGQFAPFINAAGQAFGQATTPIWPTLPQYNVSGLPQAGISSIANAPQYAAAAAQPIAPTVQPYAQLAQTSAASAPQNLAAFYSPFTQQVAGNLQNLFNQQNAQQLAQVAGSEVGQGAFGGDRQAVAEALTAQQQQLAQAPVMAQTLQQGFQAAQQQAAQQAALETQAATQGGQLMAGALGQQGQLGLGAGQLNLAAGQGLMQDFAQQQQAQMAAEQANAWLASQAGFGMGQLGQEQQTLGLQGLGALEQAGLLQQQLQQYQLNVPYSEWQQMQAWPYQQLQFAAPIVEGVGSLSGGTAATSQAAPSTLSQLAGLGLTGAGILSATGGLGSGGWLSNLFSGASPTGGTTGVDFASSGPGDVSGGPGQPAQPIGQDFSGGTGGTKRGGRVGGYQAGGGIGTGTGLGSGGLSFDPSFPGELADVPIEPTDLIPTTSGAQNQGLRGTGPPGLGGGARGVSGGVGGTGASSNPFQTGLQALQLGTGIGNTVQGLTSGTGFLGTIGSGIGSLVSGIGSIFGLEKGGAVDGYQAGGEMQQQQSPQPRAGGFLPVPAIPQSLIMPMDRVGAGPGPAIRGPGPPGGGSGPPQPPRPQESGFDPLKTLEDPSKSLPLIKGLFGKSTTPGGTSTSETSPPEAAEGGSYQAGGQIDPNMGFGMTADLLRAGGGGPNPMMDSLGPSRGGLAGGSFGSRSGINGPNLGFQIPHHFRVQEGGETGSEATTEPLLGETQTSGMMTPQMQGLLAQGQNMSIEQLQEAEAAHPQYAQLYNLIRMRKQLSSPMTAGQETSAAMASGLASGLPTSNLTTNFLPLVTQGTSGQPAPVGGGSLLPTQTAAEGGDIRGPRNYVTEDELDPHPVVDHSGKTIVVHYPSEGKSLDLGLPTSFKQHARAKYGGRIRMQSGGATPPEYGELGGGGGFMGMPAGAFTGFNQGYPGISGAGFNAPGRAPGFQFEPSQAGWYGAGAGYMPQFNPQRSALMSEIMQPTGNPFAGISPVQFPNVGQATAPQQMTYRDLTGPQISGATYGLGANAQVQNPPAIPFSSLGVTPQNPNAWLNSIAAGVARGGRIRLQDGGSDTQDAPLDANTIELLRRSGLDPAALARVARAPSRRAATLRQSPPVSPIAQAPAEVSPSSHYQGSAAQTLQQAGQRELARRVQEDPGRTVGPTFPLYSPPSLWQRWTGGVQSPAQVPPTPATMITPAIQAPVRLPPSFIPGTDTPLDPEGVATQHPQTILNQINPNVQMPGTPGWGGGGLSTAAARGALPSHPARQPRSAAVQSPGLGTTADELNRQELGLLQSGYRGPIPVSPADELNRQQLSTVNPTGMQIGRTYFGPGVDPAYGTATGLGQQPPTATGPHPPQQLHDYFYPKGEAGGWLDTGSFKPGWDRQPAGTGPAREPDTYMPMTDPATGVRYRAPGWNNPPTDTDDTTPTAPVTPVERTPLGPSVVTPSGFGAAIGGRIRLQGGGGSDTIEETPTSTAPISPAQDAAPGFFSDYFPHIGRDIAAFGRRIGLTSDQSATQTPPVTALPTRAPRAPGEVPVPPATMVKAHDPADYVTEDPARTLGPPVPLPPAQRNVPPLPAPPPAIETPPQAAPASYQPQGIGVTPQATTGQSTTSGLGAAYSDMEAAVNRALARVQQQQEGGGFYGSPGMAMMAAGLGMLGGGSPWAGVNIGRGGLEGLRMYAEQQQAQPKLELERAQAAKAEADIAMLPFDLRMRMAGAQAFDTDEPVTGGAPGAPGAPAVPAVAPGVTTPSGTPRGGPIPPSAFTQEANNQNISPALVGVTAGIESDWGRDTSNKKSPSNTGVFQMAPAGAPGSMTDTIPNQLKVGVAGLVKERDDLAKALGRTPTDAEVYGAHQQGVHGFTKLLNNPDTPAGQLLPEKNLTNNHLDPHAPARQAVAQLAKLYADYEAQWNKLAGQAPADRRVQIAQGPSATVTDATAGPMPTAHLPAPQATPLAQLAASQGLQVVPGMGTATTDPQLELYDRDYAQTAQEIARTRRAMKYWAYADPQKAIQLERTLSNLMSHYGNILTNDPRSKGLAAGEEAAARLPYQIAEEAGKRGLQEGTYNVQLPYGEATLKAPYLDVLNRRAPGQEFGPALRPEEWSPPQQAVTRDLHGGTPGIYDPTPQSLVARGVPRIPGVISGEISRQDIQKRIDADQKTYESMQQSAAAAQVALPRLRELGELLHKYNTGAITGSDWLTNTLAVVKQVPGLRNLIPADLDPTNAQQIRKLAMQQIFELVQSMHGRPLVSEIMGFSQTVPGLTLTREANDAILANLMQVPTLVLDEYANATSVRNAYGYQLGDFEANYIRKSPAQEILNNLRAETSAGRQAQQQAPDWIPQQYRDVARLSPQGWVRPNPKAGQPGEQPYILMKQAPAGRTP